MNYFTLNFPSNVQYQFRSIYNLKNKLKDERREDGGKITKKRNRLSIYITYIYNMKKKY